MFRLPSPEVVSAAKLRVNVARQVQAMLAIQLTVKQLLPPVETDIQGYSDRDMLVGSEWAIQLIDKQQGRDLLPTLLSPPALAFLPAYREALQTSLRLDHTENTLQLLHV